MTSHTGLSDYTNEVHTLNRTKTKAGNTAQIPERMPIITNVKYQNALTFSKNNYAYLQPLSNTKGLKYKDGILYFEDRAIAPTELTAELTQKNIESFNLPLLRALYAIILTKIFGSLSAEQDIDEAIIIYFPEFSRKIGKSANISKSDLNKCLEYFKDFQTVVGIICNGTEPPVALPVLINLKYNEAKNIISFHSPYIMRLIKNIHETSIRKNKEGLPLLKKNGEPQMFPSHSYLIDMSIVKEKNRRAVEIVIIVVTLIEQAGNNIPHIRAKTIIERNTLLHMALDSQTTGNKNILLKRAFSKAWELLIYKTALTKAYANIQLPNPKDPSAIPTVSRLNMLFDFTHDGKNKKI